MAVRRRKDRSAIRNSGQRREVMSGHVSRSRTYFLMVVGTVVLILAAVGIVHITSALSTGAKGLEPPDPQSPFPPSPSVLRKFKTGAVCSDGPPCSSIGSYVLRENGSAVDAAIATLFCNGIVNCHSMGLGGGFFMTIYEKGTGKAYFLNARERAPVAASEEMYGGNPERARRGPLAIGVPGELAGYWEAHQRFGRLPWSRLIEPSLRICRDGYNMSEHQRNALSIAMDHVQKDETLRDIFIDPATGKARNAGSKIVQTRMCETLLIISALGAKSLYAGDLGRMLVEDVREMGGVLTMEDLTHYRAEWSEPIRLKMRNGDEILTSPPPGGGPVLSLILNILNGYNFTDQSINTIPDTVLTYHRMVEAFKYAFAKRTELGDPKFVDVGFVKNWTDQSFGESIRQRIHDNHTNNDPSHYGAVFFNQEDHGTAHVSVISPEGDAVSVTSTINLYFGSGLASKTTGIILNSVMDDFSSSTFKNFFGVPGSPANLLESFKQPLSSMSPTIMIDSDGEVKLVIGAAGGTKIPTAVAYVIIRHVWLGDDIKAAIDSSRIHHQLYPMSMFYEYGVLEDIVIGLQRLGHQVTRYRNRISVICAIARENGTILANADYRKKGDVRGF